MTKREKTFTLGISDWDEISSFIINSDEASDYLKSVAEKIREKI